MIPAATELPTSRFTAGEPPPTGCDRCVRWAPRWVLVVAFADGGEGAEWVLCDRHLAAEREFFRLAEAEGEIAVVVEPLDDAIARAIPVNRTDVEVEPRQSREVR